MAIAMVVLLAGCITTVPEAGVLIHRKSLYQQHTTIISASGPLTEQQSQQILARLEQNQKTPTDILDRHLAFEQALSNVPLVTGNKVVLLENGAKTYNAMLAAIHSATDNINVEMYTFSDGPVGTMFADALIERQRHGVQVNLVYDSFGSFATSAAFFDQMRQAGIAVLDYRPLNPFEAKHQWTLGHRNHRKLMVIDGRIAFTGGINISEVYGSASDSDDTHANAPPEYWRDTDVEIYGPVVAEFQRLFINEWNYQKGSTLAQRNYFPALTQQGNMIVRLVASVPERFSLIYIDLISAIRNSETNVYITDAYFAPDRQMLHALENAARRGVDVRLLLPSKSDEAFIVSAQRSHYQALLKAGVKIYEWQGKMLHAKTVTIDGVWSTVGSSNLDGWSIARNNEIDAIILSHHFGEEMNLMFANDLEGSDQIKLEEWRHRGFRERVDETTAQMIEPLL